MSDSVYQKGILRLEDANINRAKEGLRVLEDIARFVIDRPILSQKARELRHQASNLFSHLGLMSQIEARDSVADSGAGYSVPTRKNLQSVVMANARRAEEALRVLEEFSESPDGIKDMRYQLYELEKDLIREVRLFPFFSGVVYLVTDQLDLAALGLDQGAGVLQLRDKNLKGSELYKKAEDFKKLADRYKVPFIINDDCELAVKVEADGVHLGQDDETTEEARKKLKPGQILGRSTHSLEQALKAISDQVDYFAVGPIHATPTKPGRTAVGYAYLEQVVQLKSAIPFVVIGGIHLGNMNELTRRGANNIAVVRAVSEISEMKKKLNSDAN